MARITLLELKSHTQEIADRAEEGETIEVARMGVHLFTLVPASPPPDLFIVELEWGREAVSEDAARAAVAKGGNLLDFKLIPRVGRDVMVVNVTSDEVLRITGHPLRSARSV